ncbi:Transposase [Caligus rogercresseyi]|uniref:Transposase n=1 Tax=Caligus rogercresseyi TaxID=217165 RepID=A0A7T8QU85_CALRO|nr:Transposase [Caligus rogercresseyi]
MSSFVPTNYALRTALLFCFHVKKTAAESHRMLLEAFGEHALGKKYGDFDVRNEERGRPPKKFEDADLRALLDEDDAQTQQQLADKLKTTQGDFAAPAHKANRFFSTRLFTDLAPSDYYLFASMGHALAEQRFTSYEYVRKWLDDWFASKEQQFFGEESTNCQKDGENV